MTEERAFLRAYDPSAFPPFAVTVDVVLLTVREGVLSVLLVERETHPFRARLALPGGFVAPEEDLEAAAVRRLEAETGSVQVRFYEQGNLRFERSNNSLPTGLWGFWHRLQGHEQPNLFSITFAHPCVCTSLYNLFPQLLCDPFLTTGSPPDF